MPPLSTVRQALQLLTRLQRDVRGVTMLEYGLLAAIMAGIIAGSYTVMGRSLSSEFTFLGNALHNAASGS